MEAALVNVLSPGDKMLALVAGSFGERWTAIGRAHGMAVQELRAAWGEAVAPEEVARALDADPAIRAVFVQLNESSTGAAHDVEAMARITRARQDTLLVVDAISGAGALAPGDAGLGRGRGRGREPEGARPAAGPRLRVGERAGLDAHREARAPAASTSTCAASARRRRAGSPPSRPPSPTWSPCAPRWRRWRRRAVSTRSSRNAATLAAITRKAAEALGLPLVAPRAHGDALTALYPPKGLESGAIVKAPASPSSAPPSPADRAS